MGPTLPCRPHPPATHSWGGPPEHAGSPPHQPPLATPALPEQGESLTRPRISCPPHLARRVLWPPPWERPTRTRSGRSGARGRDPDLDPADPADSGSEQPPPTQGAPPPNPSVRPEGPGLRRGHGCPRRNPSLAGARASQLRRVGAGAATPAPSAPCPGLSENAPQLESAPGRLEARSALGRPRDPARLTWALASLGTRSGAAATCRPQRRGAPRPRAPIGPRPARPAPSAPIGFSERVSRPPTLAHWLPPSRPSPPHWLAALPRPQKFQVWAGQRAGPSRGPPRRSPPPPPTPRRTRTRGGCGPPSGASGQVSGPAPGRTSFLSSLQVWLGWLRTHPGAWSGVSLEAPGNKQPLPFWVLVSRETVHSPFLPGLLGALASGECWGWGPELGRRERKRRTPHHRQSSRTSRMAPKSGPGAEEAEEEALSCPADRESVSGHLGPPAGTPAASATPTSLPDPTPHSSRVACSADPQLAPESLDPRTLRLLWGQRELEIQALRWEVQSGRDTRLCRILQEVAGLPPKRSSHSQEKLLQSRVQKLTLQLKEQKERAQWALLEQEKEYLEERLLETTRRLQEVEAELQNFQKSCLLQLARSSWVGRMLRSQTGSVEVVTAGTLMDPSDLSEDIQAPTGEGFRLEDVDWNSIAHRYPNLFTNMELDSQQKQPWPWPQLDAGSPRSPGKHSEGHHKTVNWGSLPCLGTSSSGGADSDSSSCQPGLTDHLLKASGHSPQGWGASSHQALVQARSSGRGSEDFQKTRSTRHPKPVPAPELCTDPDYPGPEHQQSPTRSCLKIVAVSVRKKLVRILNQSQQETADLGGAVLKQLVWGEGPRNAKKPPRASSGREPDPSHSGRDCVTLLLDPKGEVLSEHRIPHCATPAPTVFVDGTDLSIDSFPLPEAGPGADPCGPPGTLRRGSVLREPRVGRRRPRTRALQPSSASSGKRFHPREPPAQHLPPIPGERAPEGERGPPDPTPPPADKERRVRVCRKSVERSCPMVALSVPSTAESRYGFRFLSFLPFTADACRRA
ncbi:lamin tail domain-containing protein 2 isoform X3 [Saimiri boliviensis]|uniref:lamin tail domain-containing protein 2 isoform X3 n=1 Tax=Saimiri boliviensis TaxID=27679 RepID=UPI003D775CF0